jgi:hypothetical protein
MKKVVMIAVAVLLTVGLVHAENSWGPVAAYWDTADAAEGTGIGLVFSFAVSPTLFLDARYTWFEDFGATGSDVTLEIEPIEVGLSVVKASDRAAFRIGGGLGYYMMDGSISQTPGVTISYDPDDEIGGYVSVGLELNLVDDFNENIMAKRMTLFVEGMYRFVSVDEVNVSRVGGNLRQEGTLDGAGGNVGIRFTW